MQYSTEAKASATSVAGWLGSIVGRIVISLFVPLLTFLILWQGFLFLRDSAAPKIVVAIVAILWGVGGVALLYLVSNWLVEQLPSQWVRWLQPFVFVGPAIAILAWYLAIPTARTLWLSLLNNNSTEFVGLANYGTIFTDRNLAHHLCE